MHHLTPLGVLHIVAFVTLCEAYMGIEPPLNSVELLLPRLATAGLRCESGSVGLCGHLCPIWARNPFVLSPLDVQPSGPMAERMVFSMERCRRASSYVHG
jgi:hypothetical protein